MEERDKLKPCPFCPLSGLYVECSDCIDGFMPTKWHYDTGEEAVEVWSRRTKDEHID